MKPKTVLSVIALLLGEAVIIGGFFLWRGEDTPDNIFALNIVVSSIVYCLCFVDVLFPWIRQKDASGRQVGSLGLRWTVTGLYALSAICAMLILNKAMDAAFLTQLIVHAILIFLLILGFVAVFQSSGKVAEVHSVQTGQRQGVTEMGHAVTALEEALYDCPGVPQDLIDKVRELKESIRYISPSNNPEACGQERQFVETIEQAAGRLYDFEHNREDVERAVIKAGRILRSRKEAYSN
ncbi:MAG TPA: hypothetical protein IAC03_02450 [Candidatus Coprenecus pullistercoris]|nr:hypothetical protein [Candidatus Coprenecus pullistercoris]